MKRMGLFFIFFASVGGFLLIGSLDYQKDYSWKQPELLERFTYFHTFDLQWRKHLRRKKIDLSKFENAQNAISWARIYTISEDLEVYAVQQTQEDGYVLAGRIEKQLWVSELTPTGEIAWQKTYGNNTRAISVDQTNDGGYILGGAKFRGIKKDLLVMKLNPYGDVDWQKIYTSPNIPKDFYENGAHSIQQTNDGGFVVAGSIRAIEGDYGDFWILKLFMNGDVEWQKVYGGLGWEGAFCIQATSDGGFITIGHRGNFYNWDYWILKLSPEGNIEWQKAYGGIAFHEGWCVRETDDGGYIVAGFTDDFGTAILGKHSAWILKLYKSGDIEWQKTISREGNDLRAFSVNQTKDAGYVVAGKAYRTYGAEDEGDIWLLKLSALGDIEWQKVYLHQVDFFDILSFDKTADGGYILTTNFGYPTDDSNCLVLKLLPNGNLGSCGFESNFSPIVSDTSIVPEETNAIPIFINVNVQASEISPIDTNVKTIALCSSLNQPPINISCKQEVNRGLFRKEFYFTLRWTRNPDNNNYTIEEYRIYRANQDLNNFQLIGSVPGDKLAFSDGPINNEDQYIYSLTSVSSDGTESPMSEPVKSWE
jgi:hypothetical protein